MQELDDPAVRLLTILTILKTLTPFFYFVLGATFGSFLNVVIYRLPRGLSVSRPSSRCPSCETPIKPWHNIPVLSWFWLRGRCASCGAPFSIRYALVELLTGLLAAALWLRLGGLSPLLSPDPLPLIVPYLFWFYLCFTLLAVVFIDAEHFVIPATLVLPGIALGALSPLVTQAVGGAPLISFSSALYGALIGGAALLSVSLAFLFLRRKEGMGEGDIILVMLIGAYLGPVSLLFVFLGSSLQGLLFTGLFWRKVQAQGLRIPFGPFLALAALEWLFFSDLLLARFEQWFIVY
jgi:leader peptidase (prepilin peptidase) / N-methyltransferase